MQEMFLRKIPEDMRPWECNVNGVKYVYPAGTEQNVPAEVAALIDAYWEKQEVDYPETGISFNDLRDRPFGDSTEVLFDQRVEFQDVGEGMMGCDCIFPELLEAGTTYIVTYNGVSYNCIPLDPAGVGIPSALGNMLPFGAEDTGEPFLIAVPPNEVEAPYPMTILSINGDTSATIRIEKSVIHTIDPKFIPAGVGGGVVIVQDSAMASGVAVVGQAPTTATMNAAQIAEAIFAAKTVYFLEPNDGTLLPFVYGYRFGELASGVMTLSAAPEPYALFGAHDSDGYYHRIKVYSDGAYTTGGFSVGS